MIEVDLETYSKEQLVALINQRIDELINTPLQGLRDNPANFNWIAVLNYWSEHYLQPVCEVYYKKFPEENDYYKKENNA